VKFVTKTTNNKCQMQEESSKVYASLTCLSFVQRRKREKITWEIRGVFPFLTADDRNYK
jgi:hypothetical protein